MSDEELIAKLKATAPEAPEDPALWASIEAGVRDGIARQAPRRIGWRGSLVGLGLAAAAAMLALFLHLRGNHPHLAPHGVDETALLPDEDPAELVGDLDLDELQAVESHFHGGV
jgi:hypothetical protein